MGRKSIFVNLIDICMTLSIILEYWIQYCMYYVHDISILGYFWQARIVGGRVVSYRDCLKITAGREITELYSC